MARYLVTGGAGFIGSNIVEALVQSEEEVRAVDNFITGKKENLDLFRNKIEFIEGDIREKAFCDKAVQGIDFVLHQAALPSVERSIVDPGLTAEINILGTLNLLFASSRAGVKRFIFASSSSVYGDHPLQPKKEGVEGAPLSPYAVSKHAGEMYCQVFSEIYELPTVCLRYFNVFGPRQDPTSHYSAAIPIFIRRILDGQPPIIFGDGEQTRDFTYVKNVVKANLLAVEADDVSGEVFNIACGQGISVNSMAKRIITKIGQNFQPEHDQPRSGEVRHSTAKITKAENKLGYKPDISFKEGLNRTIEWYRKQ